MTGKYEVVCDIRCQLGEGPLWSARENAIYWVDILEPALHRYSLIDHGVRSWPMPEKLGWVVERRDRAGFIAGLQSGFAELTLDPFICRGIADPEPHYPDNRMNDAKVDHLGRIWAGTMDCDVGSASGSLYCLDRNFEVTKHDSGYLVTNGPAFSPACDCLYHSDTGRGVVYRFELTPDGSIRNREVFIEFPKKWGYPDGMTVDAAGGVWIAHWGGGRVSRFTPDGAVDRDVRLPASQITSCVFAGENLDRMFVTSAAVDRADEPLAGCLFEIDPGTTGLAPNLFDG
ncbi:MAG TPA: SMP-30/gluconolactonase/LRE family protein [Woeseiaceae bacterium]|nr:SMP-30/gluconolactonase/LRE family protein [Woeseiaceae bacterium]